MLSDPKKRKVYDQFGQYSDNLADAGAARGPDGGRTAPGFDFSGFDWSTTTTPGGSAGGSSFRDIFADLFGGAAAKEPEPPRPQPKKGAEIEMPLALSFEEAINGLTTNLTVNRSEQCSRCNGAGDIGGPVMVCATCKGTGQVNERAAATFCAGMYRLWRHRPPAIAVFTVQRQGHRAENRNSESSHSRRSRDGFTGSHSR